VLGGGELDRESSRGGVEYLPWGSRPPWNRIGAEEDGACYWGVVSCKKKGDRPGEDGGQVRLLKELHGKAGMAGFGAKKLWASRGWANWIWPAAGLRGGELSAPRNGGEGSACAMAKLQAGRRKKTGSDSNLWGVELHPGGSSAMGEAWLGRAAGPTGECAWKNTQGKQAPVLEKKFLCARNREEGTGERIGSHQRRRWRGAPWGKC
jgi:hypothetical protein